MPIPLGIFAVAGAGAAGGVPAMELISTQLITTNTATVTFSSIPATYKHLQIRMVSRMDSFSNLAVRLNSDTGANYAEHRLRGNGASVSSGSSTSASSAVIGETVVGGMTANAFSAVVCDLLDYANTSKNTTLRTLSGFHDSAFPQTIVQLRSNLWMNTAAVTTITILGNSNHVSGSRFSLYGIRG